jgi:hypothetical protein
MEGCCSVSFVGATISSLFQNNFICNRIGNIMLVRLYTKYAQMSGFTLAKPPDYKSFYLFDACVVH